ncbi:flagellar export chaperone FliS [bacterium]|nr:flagellar export chaperone FliS [bacterium]
MRPANPYNQYLDTSFSTASPARLVVMTYDASIRALREAARSIRDNDYESRARSFDLALALISELRKSLNPEKGGEIATKLDSLYQFFTRETLLSNATSDPERLTPIISLMTELRQTWDKASKQEATGNTEQSV